MPPVQHRDGFLTTWVPVAAWMALIFLLSAQPQLPGPPSPLLNVAGHFLEYAILAFLLARAFSHSAREDEPRVVLWSLTIAGLYAASDEFHQSFAPGRTADVFDWIWDLAGSIAGIIAWWWLFPKIRRG